jgi:UDP-N-acetylglucosamine:LPS N-acetylglucosamine transferase
MVVRRGGAIIRHEAGMESAKLAADILEIISDPAGMEKMGEKAREVSFPDATELIVRECLALAGLTGA